MKKTVALCMLLTLGAFAYPVLASDSGTFRGKWWNYYDRGMEYAERGELDKALEDLRTAVRKRGRDQRMARTYGMHFVDYFPHRELGIVLYNQGDLKQAAKELESSIKSEESAKAVFYLNKVEEALLKKQKTSAAAPAITVLSPASGSTVKTSTVVIKGKASGRGIVSAVTVNGEPYRFDRAREHVEFSQEITVQDGRNEIAIEARDLLGSATTSTVVLMVDKDGPAVQVFDIAREQEGGKEYLRLTGEISDATWISRLQVNGTSVDVGGEKSYPLNIRYETGQPARLAVVAGDPFENETVAELDVEKALVAYERPFKPFMVALNLDRLIGFDKQAPTITLRAAKDLPPVFSGKFAVEGRAFDNRNIGRIVINGKDVFVKRGKTIFFSKVVDLREGRNNVTVEVHDTSGNKSKRTFSVKRKIPAVMQNASRMSITVLPFDGGRAADRIRLAYDQLIGAFVEQKRFNIVERSKLEQILLEQKLTREKLTDPANSIRVGKLMSADAILATTVREDGRSLEVVARVISTETSEVLDVKDAYAEDKGAGAVKELMTALASKVASGFPVAEGMVVKAKRKEVTIDLGETSNIKKNMRVIVYRRGQELKHPVTGRSLGWETVKLAEGRVEDVEAAFSTVELLKRPAPKRIEVRDLVITK